MKISCLSALLLSASAQDAFRPTRLTLKDLSTANVEKVVSTAGFFTIDTQDAAFKLQKTAVLKAMTECVPFSTSAVDHVFPDGTLRQTFATHTRQAVHKAVEMGPLFENTESSEACQELDKLSLGFRLKIMEITKEVASVLAKVSGDAGKKPLLKTKEGFKFEDFNKVVKHGEHLEHFHAYTKKKASDDITLDWHTDQGIFLVFTPGQSGDSLTEGGDLYVKDDQGATRPVSFENDDDVVILMGDGMIQLFSQDKFHAPAHAVKIKVSKKPRVWYGRMVLAPSEAQHPTMPDVTFKEHRMGMMSDNSGALAVGCSSDTMTARHLEGAASCNSTGQLYCWHRCQNYTETVSATACTSKKVMCASDKTGIKWNGEDHSPEFKLACAKKDGGGDSSTVSGNASLSPGTAPAAVPTVATSGKSSAPATSGGYPLMMLSMVLLSGFYA